MRGCSCQILKQKRKEKRHVDFAGKLLTTIYIQKCDDLPYSSPQLSRSIVLRCIHMNFMARMLLVKQAYSLAFPNPCPLSHKFWATLKGWNGKTLECFSGWGRSSPGLCFFVTAWLHKQQFSLPFVHHSPSPNRKCCVSPCCSWISL